MPSLGSNNRTPLQSLGIGHGAQLFLRYNMERSIEGPPRSKFETRPFGAHMDVALMVAAQTRIERQETPDCPNASFDGDAIHAFQSYVSAAIAFSIKRGGILYGTGNLCDLAWLYSAGTSLLPHNSRSIHAEQIHAFSE